MVALPGGAVDPACTTRFSKGASAAAAGRRCSGCASSTRRRSRPGFAARFFGRWSSWLPAQIVTRSWYFMALAGRRPDPPAKRDGVSLMGIAGGNSGHRILAVLFSRRAGATVIAAMHDRATRHAGRAAPESRSRRERTRQSSARDGCAARFAGGQRGSVLMSCAPESLDASLDCSIGRHGRRLRRSAPPRRVDGTPAGRDSAASRVAARSRPAGAGALAERTADRRRSAGTRTKRSTGGRSSRRSPQPQPWSRVRHWLADLRARSPRQ